MLEDMTPDQMEKTAESLLYCIQNRSMEDAFMWIVQLNYALHRHEFRKYVAVTNQIEDMAKTLRADHPR